MSSWPETTAVLDRLAALHAAGAPCALATVIDVRGSAYRRAGAKLLVAKDGETTGNISGGCLEGDVREVALRVIATGVAERRVYCSAPGDDIGAWDLGVGCDGRVEVLIEPVHDDWGEVREALAMGASLVVDTPLRPLPTGTRSVTIGSSDVQSGLSHDDRAGEMFRDVLVTPPGLLIIGAGDGARPLAELAHTSGFRVTVLDRRPGLLTRERFPVPTRLIDGMPDAAIIPTLVDATTFVVLMTHSFADDRAYLAALLPLPLRYLGILGPRSRTARLQEQLGAGSDARIHGPVGLDIGGEGAIQIAVAILAELLAVRAGRSATPLRERLAPIHAHE